MVQNCFLAFVRVYMDRYGRLGCYRALALCIVVGLGFFYVCVPSACQCVLFARKTNKLISGSDL